MLVFRYGLPYESIQCSFFAFSIPLLIPTIDEERPLMINYIICDKVTNTKQKVHPQRHSTLQNVFAHYLGVFLHVDRLQF